MGLFNHEHQLSQRRKKKIYNNPSTSLIHVMNLFEEKNKCHMPPPGPLPIKANGAIVVHRPSLHNNNLCFSDYDDDGEDDDESNTTSSSLPSSGDTSLLSDIKEDEELKLLLQENRKLKQKIYADKMKKEQLADDLFYAQQKIRQLERMNQRFEKIILSPKQQTTRHHARRQSTNSISHYQAQISSENKIQILLDEIEAMENEAWCCCSHRKSGGGEIIPTDKSTK